MTPEHLRAVEEAEGRRRGRGGAGGSRVQMGMCVRALEAAGRELRHCNRRRGMLVLLDFVRDAGHGGQGVCLPTCTTACGKTTF